MWKWRNSKKRSRTLSKFFYNKNAVYLICGIEIIILCYIKTKGEEMNKNKTIRLVTILTAAFFALSLLSSVQFVKAYTFPRSVNVALVPDGYCSRGGSLYQGSSWPDGLTFTFSNLSPSAIADGAQANPLTAYDTVMLMTSDFNFESYWSDTDFSSRITSFVAGGGKLIIYVSETSYWSSQPFENFIVPFTIINPGATGSSGGTIVNIEDDTLSSSNQAADEYPNGLQSYINLPLLVSSTDAVGDLTVMTNPVDPSWYIDMTGINVDEDGGPAHAYAFYGDGLIIYNGFDVDYGSQSYPPSNAAGRNVIQMVWWRELCGQELGEGQSVSGLTLTPATATNPINTQHTVTALVKDNINNPVPGVVVDFEILSGPNAGATGSATTDANGEATFSWSSSTDGVDTVQASITITPAGAAPIEITTTATKTWYIVPDNVIPEVPLGTAAVTATMMIGLAAYYTKRRTKPKL